MARKYVLTLGADSAARRYDYAPEAEHPIYTELPFDSVSPEDFEVAGNSFCFSGTFELGRGALENFVHQDGGTVENDVSALTHFVVVGGKPSAKWKFGNYGTKINKAIKYRRQRGNPLLLREADFMQFTGLGSTPEQLLDLIISGSLRSSRLLDSFEGGYTNNWACCVPAAFRPCLDIVQTTRMEDRVEKLVWTQGSNFSFDIGDTFYDCLEAYTLPWADALRCIQFMLQVTGLFADVVVFDIYIPNPEKTGLIKHEKARATQSEFVRLLITGSCSGIDPEHVNE